MSVKKLDKAEWGAFFDTLSRTLQGAGAEINAMSLSIGSQVEANWRPIIGLTYDPKDDIVELALEGIDHLIEKPSEIFFDEEAGRLGALKIVDRNNVTQVVEFREPLSLPPPHGS